MFTPVSSCSHQSVSQTMLTPVSQSGHVHISRSVSQAMLTPVDQLVRPCSHQSISQSGHAHTSSKKTSPVTQKHYLLVPYVHPLIPPTVVSGVKASHPVHFFTPPMVVWGVTASHPVHFFSPPTVVSGVTYSIASSTCSISSVSSF